MRWGLRELSVPGGKMNTLDALICAALGCLFIGALLVEWLLDTRERE